MHPVSIHITPVRLQLRPNVMNQVQTPSRHYLLLPLHRIRIPSTTHIHIHVHTTPLFTQKAQRTCRRCSCCSTPEVTNDHHQDQHHQHQQPYPILTYTLPSFLSYIPDPILSPPSIIQSPISSTTTITATTAT